MTAAVDLESVGILVPFGKHGNVKAICPKCSHNRRPGHQRERCLYVDVDEGVWKCFNCGWTGSVKAGGGLAYGAPLGRRETPRTYAKPEPMPEATLPPKAVQFFADRSIPLSIVERHGITVGPDGGLKFPYTRDGELVNIKTRYPNKKFRMEPGAELIFWGLDDCKGAPQVVIVEGEMDKLAVEAVGLRAVLSVPNGASVGEMPYLPSGEHIFERALVIIAVDNDADGQRLEAELARRIGKERCFRTVWPEGCKDANDVLMQHGEIVLRECLGEARPFPIAGIVNPRDVMDDYLAAYDRGVDGGLSTGWPSLDQGYTVKTGQMTIVGGMPGSGKSEVLDALMVNLATKHNWNFAVYSPENFPPDTHLRKWAKKIKGKPFWGPRRMTRQEAIDALEWAAEHLDFLIPDDDSTLDTVIGLAEALVYRNGINGLVIDPWNNMDHERPKHMSETEYISQSLTRIRQFARMFDVHVWVLAHPTKMTKDKDGEYPVPTPYDISGSSNWYNKADNIFTVYRNKGDKLALVELHIQKIRFRECGELGVCGLRYIEETGQYLDVGEWTPAGG